MTDQPAGHHQPDDQPHDAACRSLIAVAGCTCWCHVGSDQPAPAYDAGDAAPATPWTVTIGGVDIPAALDQARAELASARQEITALHHLADERTRERDLWRARCDAHAWDRITRERDRLDRELTEAMAILARIGDALSPTGERPEEALGTLAADVQAYVQRAERDRHAAATAERERIRRLLIRPLLDARRCIPDGEIVKGCLRFDGARVRDRLRTAFTEAFPTADPTPPPSPGAQVELAERQADELEQARAEAAETERALMANLAELEQVRGQLAETQHQLRQANRRIADDTSKTADHWENIAAERAGWRETAETHQAALTAAVGQVESLTTVTRVLREQAQRAEADRDRYAAHLAQLRALYADNADGPPISGDWLMGQLRELTTGDQPSPGTPNPGPQSPTALCILGPTRPAADIRGDIAPARVLAALEQLGWPDDRTASAHVEPDGWQLTGIGHYYSMAEDVIRAADQAGDTTPAGGPALPDGDPKITDHWAIYRASVPDGEGVGLPRHTRAEAETALAEWLALPRRYPVQGHIVHRHVYRWPDGTALIDPWVPVPADPAPANGEAGQ